MENEIVKSEPKEPIVWQIETLEKMADYVVKGRLFANITTKENAMTLFMLCQAEGLHPMEACKQYDIIQGKPTLKADAMLARFQSRGGKWKWTETSDTRAAALVNDMEIDFTFQEAAALGLTGKDNYKKQPATMLRKRLIGKAIRMVDPGAVLGLYNESEILDITDKTTTVTEGTNGKAQDLRRPTTVETTAKREPEPAQEQKKPEAVDKLTPAQKKLFDLLKTYCQGEGDQVEMLKQLTEWEDKEGKVHEGRTTFKGMSDKMADIARHKLEAIIKANEKAHEPEPEQEAQ